MKSAFTFWVVVSVISLYSSAHAEQPEFGHYIQMGRQDVGLEKLAHLFVTKIDDTHVEIQRFVYNNTNTYAKSWCGFKPATYQFVQNKDVYQRVSGGSQDNYWTGYAPYYKFNKDYKNLSNDIDLTDRIHLEEFILFSQDKNEFSSALRKVQHREDCQPYEAYIPAPPPPPIDPIVFDLNGNGFSFSDIRDDFDLSIADSSTHPTHNTMTITYYKYNTAWSKDPDDGFLIYDGGFEDVFYSRQFVGDSILDPFAETHTLSTDWLALYDLDKNGVIDENDPIFPYLSIWIDRNLDGKVNPYEKRGLKDYGILSINLNSFVKSGQQDEHGNQILSTGAAKNINGSSIPVVDVSLRTHEFEYDIHL